MRPPPSTTATRRAAGSKQATSSLEATGIRLPAPATDDGAGVDAATPLRRVDEPPAARARARGGSERGGQHAPYAAAAIQQHGALTDRREQRGRPSTGIGPRWRRRRARPRCSLRPRRPALRRHRSHTKLRPPPPRRSTSRDQCRTSCFGRDQGLPPHLAPAQSDEPPTLHRADGAGSGRGRLSRRSCQGTWKDSTAGRSRARVPRHRRWGSGGPGSAGSSPRATRRSN